jgi:tyrosyl-tRNA synthetase
MTITLLTNSEGKKMGKTEKGAVWLDPEKTSPYDFFQYWRNVGDGDVIKCLKLLTFLPVEQIEEMEQTMTGAELNTAKEILAYELTALIHGKEEADKCLESAKKLFGGIGNAEDMPTTEIPAAELEGGINILDLLVKTALCPSKSEARRLVVQGGVSVDDVKVTDPNGVVEIAGSVVIKKGKKVYHKAVRA